MSFFFITVYISRMSNVLVDFGNHIHSLKAKFTEARKELQTEEEENHRTNIRPARLAYTGNQHLERCD